MSAWAETAHRWWRINIEWLANAAKEKGPEYAARHFLQEFFYEENGPWVRRMIGEVLRTMPARAWEKTNGRGQTATADKETRRGGDKEQQRRGQTATGDKETGRGGDEEQQRRGQTATTGNGGDRERQRQGTRGRLQKAAGSNGKNGSHGWAREDADQQRQQQQTAATDGHGTARTNNSGNGHGNGSGQVGGRNGRCLAAEGTDDVGDAAARAAGE